MIVPPTTKLNFQIYVDNAWRDLSESSVQENGSSFLNTLPVLLPFRAVMLGTQDVLPVVDLAKSQVMVERPKTTFKHISTPRTLPGSSTTKQVVVGVNLSNFDTNYHTLVVKLLSGSGYSTVVTASASTLVADPNRPEGDKAFEKKFTFSLGTAIASYKIQIEGTTTSATNTFHVEKRTDNSIY